MDFKKIFAIISHAGLLIHTEHDIQTIVEHIFKMHEMPSKDDWAKVLDDSLQVLKMGIFGLSDETTQAISEILQVAKDQMTPVAPAA